MEAGAEGIQDDLKCGSSLKLTCGQHDPEALTSGASAGATCALRDDPIDDHNAQVLLTGGVVVGFQAGGCVEAEEGRPVLAETLGYFTGFGVLPPTRAASPAGRPLDAYAQDALTRPFQRGIEIWVRS